MAHEEAAATGPSKLVVKNIGLMLSGDLARPILDADALVAVDGRISAIGRAAEPRKLRCSMRRCKGPSLAMTAV